MSENQNYHQNDRKLSPNSQNEEATLAFWKENDIFEKSLQKDAPKGEYVFYDGPPTANGRPGIHHLEARAFKDAIPRYKTMQGYNVRRKGGWDTHGLPVELQVEKQLGLTSKKQIEEYGIEKFNEECKKSVWTYIDEWQQFTDRIGYWVDHKNPYVTYHSSYIESLWNIVREVENQGLLYKDYRIVPWCSRCGTALSSHELAQGYSDVKDLSVTAKFRVVGQENTYFLAWTTTPWTLPGNVALAVKEDMDYVKIKVSNNLVTEYYILAWSLVNKVFQKDLIDAEKGFGVTLSGPLGGEHTLYDVSGRYFGRDLVGLEYEPLYPYFSQQLPDSQKENLEKAYKVYSADFVTANDGTGIVHTAVMYGQDDFELGTQLGLPKYHLVKEDGHFKDGMDFLSGRFVRDEDVAIDIIKDLAHRDLLFHKEKYEHSYPFCWRCKTPLIYYARDSWYIRMSQLRDTLVANNENINWEPANVKDGRFGEWIREVKDWAISRERYWGTPLPIWQDANGKRYIFTHRDELKAHTKRSGNNYFIMRHGQANNNVDPIYNKDQYEVAVLTEEGKKQVSESAKNFNQKIDVIICSTLTRAKETAQIFCNENNLPFENVIFDERLKEWETSSIFNGKDRSIFKQYYDVEYIQSPYEVLPHSESFAQLVKRAGDFLYDIESEYQNKNILFIGHAGTMRALSFVSAGMSFVDLKNKNDKYIYLENAQISPLDFAPLPHNTEYELDLHRPYIDEYPVFDEDGNQLTRVREVMDCWFDSGAMPFAQDGYPFLTDKIHFPADYIAEGLDQTRGWFYTLHAVSALMGRTNAYKNVICLGLILDKEGQKMSKSKGNVVNPWDLCDKYGADALRFWMYSVNAPGDSKNFDEKTVDEIVKKVFNLLNNVYAFYELYPATTPLISKDYKLSSDQNVLDSWILAKLSDLNTKIVNGMESYSLILPTRAIREFVDDLSTWYLRRSRERIRNGDEDARYVLYTVLKELAKMMAPFAPFISEKLWQGLKNNSSAGEGDEESVHLTNWPTISPIMDDTILSNMQSVRGLVTKALEARQVAGIKVRQPLLTFSGGVSLPAEYVNVLCDEINVKEYIYDKDLGEATKLDTNLTPELIHEGDMRELFRAIQDLRKNSDAKPGDMLKVKLYSEIKAVQDFVYSEESNIKRLLFISEIIWAPNNGEQTTLSMGWLTISIA